MEKGLSQRKRLFPFINTIYNQRKLLLPRSIHLPISFIQRKHLLSLSRCSIFVQSCAARTLSFVIEEILYFPGKTLFPFTTLGGFSRYLKLPALAGMSFTSPYHLSGESNYFPRNVLFPRKYLFPRSTSQTIRSFLRNSLWLRFISSIVGFFQGERLFPVTSCLLMGTTT